MNHFGSKVNHFGCRIQFVCFFFLPGPAGSPGTYQQLAVEEYFVCVWAKVKVAWICVLWWVLALACALTFLPGDCFTQTVLREFLPESEVM